MKLVTKIFLALLLIWFMYILIYSRTYSLYIPKKMQTEFYDLFTRFDNMCREHQIPYFIVAGTLLGAVRHEGLIPWDDDIDVGILEKDLKRLQDVDCAKYGMIKDGVVKTNTGKFLHKDKYNNGKKMESVFIDVFVMAKDSPDDNAYYYCNPAARRSFKNEQIYDHELQNIVFYKFGSLCVPGMRDYEPYFERVYGDWKVPKFKITKMLMYPLHTIYTYIKYKWFSKLSETKTMKQRWMEKESTLVHTF